MMKRLSAALAAFAILTAPAAYGQADSYPSKAIHVICNFPPGNGSDIAVRFFSQQLSEAIGKPVVVENKVGAFGLVGARVVAEAKPDGYTIFITGVSTVISGARYLYKEVPYDPDKAFQPVTTLFKVPFVLTVDPKKPFRTVDDLTRYLRSGEAKHSYGTAANPGTISAEMYLSRINLKPERVHYRDAKQAQTEMLSGFLDFVFFDAGSTTAQAAEGRIRPLAVTSAERMPAMPDVPTMAESGFPGYEMILTWGVVVPAGTPQPIVAKLGAVFNQIVAQPKTQDFIKQMGAVPYPGNAQKMADAITAETAKWADYVRLADIKPQ